MEPDNETQNDSPVAQEETDLQEASDRVEGGEPEDDSVVANEDASASVDGQEATEQAAEGQDFPTPSE